MQNLNKLKLNLKHQLIEDKFELSKSTILNLKTDLIDILKKYTNLRSDNIKLDIKILKSNKYLIEILAQVDDFY